ncbi:cytochrome B [Pseudochryseolinea flava]|nr:cytochrome B [Pseudochryseolinea flava]
MYIGLLHTHSSVRYLVLIMLLIVIGKSLLGLVSKKPFEKIDNVFSLILLIVTHIQFLVGLILYFVSPRAGSERYFKFEHAFGMLLAVILITVARTTSKKMTDDSSKFKRLTYLNVLALVVILGTLLMGHLKIIGNTNM